MRGWSLALVVALAGCNFRIDPLGNTGSGGVGGGGASDGSVIIGGDLGADDLGGGGGGGGDLAHQGPFLQLVAVASGAAADLTADGNADWAHWGYALASDFDHKGSGGGQISSYQQIGLNAPTQYGDGLVSYRWSDGATGGGRHMNTNANGSTTGVYVLTGGLKITVPADTTVRRLKLYVGQYNAQGQLDASLGDNSAPAVSDHSFTSTNNTPVNVTYELTYAASSPGQLLTVSWTVLSATAIGNITLQSAALQQPIQ